MDDELKEFMTRIIKHLNEQDLFIQENVLLTEKIKKEKEVNLLLNNELKDLYSNIEIEYRNIFTKIFWFSINMILIFPFYAILNNYLELIYLIQVFLHECYIIVLIIIITYTHNKCVKILVNKNQKRFEKLQKKIIDNLLN